MPQHDTKCHIHLYCLRYKIGVFGKRIDYQRYSPDWSLFQEITFYKGQTCASLPSYQWDRKEVCLLFPISKQAMRRNG